MRPSIGPLACRIDTREQTQVAEVLLLRAAGRNGAGHCGLKPRRRLGPATALC